MDIYRGDHRTLELTVRDANGAANLGGTSIWFTLKRDINDPDSKAVITKKNTAAGGGDAQIKITDAPNGKAEIYIVPDDTNNLNPPAYPLHFDVQVKTVGGEVYTVLKGTMNILADVTRSS